MSRVGEGGAKPRPREEKEKIERAKQYPNNTTRKASICQKGRVGSKKPPLNHLKKRNDQQKNQVAKHYPIQEQSSAAQHARNLTSVC